MNWRQKETVGMVKNNGAWCNLNRTTAENTGSATRKPAVENPPYPARRRRTWRYDVGRARNGGPVVRSRVSARGAGQTNVRTFRRPPRARAGRQASPHRPLGSEPPLPRRERAVLLAERDGGAQARRPYRTGDGRPAKTGTRHRRRTAIPGKGPPPPGCCFAWASRPDRSPTDRPRSPAPRRFRVASKRGSNS